MKTRAMLATWFVRTTSSKAHRLRTSLPNTIPAANATRMTGTLQRSSHTAASTTAMRRIGMTMYAMGTGGPEQATSAVYLVDEARPSSRDPRPARRPLLRQRGNARTESCGVGGAARLVEQPQVVGRHLPQIRRNLGSKRRVARRAGMGFAQPAL